MSSHWRTIAALLAISTVVLGWRNCKLSARLDEAGERAERAERELAADPTRQRGAADPAGSGTDPTDTGDDPDQLAPSAARPLRLPADIPALIARFGPRKGEDLLSYRDRIVPEATAFLAPQRRRVDANLAAFSDEAGLDDDTVAAMHDAAGRAAERLRDRVIEGVMSGELLPPYRGATAIDVAHDLTTVLADYLAEVRGGLSDSQLDALAGSAFDPIDYLVFATRWEDMIGAL